MRPPPAFNKRVQWCSCLSQIVIGHGLGPVFGLWTLAGIAASESRAARTSTVSATDQIDNRHNQAVLATAGAEPALARNSSVRSANDPASRDRRSRPSQAKTPLDPDDGIFEQVASRWCAVRVFHRGGPHVQAVGASPTWAPCARMARKWLKTRHIRPIIARHSSVIFRSVVICTGARADIN
jgi:hypothetical protein